MRRRRTLHMLRLNGRPRPIVLNAHGLLTLEQLAGEPVPAVAQKLHAKTLGMQGVVWLILAMLEGGRLERRLSRKPWTIREVCDGIDAAGGWATFVAHESPQMIAMRAVWEDAMCRPGATAATVSLTDPAIVVH